MSEQQSMTDNATLDESAALLLDASAGDVVAQLKAEAASLNTDDLLVLHDAESAGKKRQTVLAEIARQLDAQNTAAGADDENNDSTGQTTSPNADGSEATGTDAASMDNDNGGKADRGEAIDDDWKAPDYNGPLTAIQAAWRNENLTTK